MFPQADHAPSVGLQSCVSSSISLHRTTQLRRPIPFVSHGLSSVIRTAMPEAAIDEDGHPTRCEHNIWPDPDATTEIQPEILAISVAQTIQLLTQRNLRLGVRTPVSFHIPRPAFVHRPRVGALGPRALTWVIAVHIRCHPCLSARSTLAQGTWEKILPRNPAHRPPSHNEEDDLSGLELVEICAGAGGQALGLELAGFHHRLAVELDPNACNTLRANREMDPRRADWVIRQGDVANPEVWKPGEYYGVDLLAGGVPCPPFSIAGQQLGATDERDLFAWAVELCAQIQPRALLLENVPGLSAPRFAGYRQHVLDRLRELDYFGEWRPLDASCFGVPQRRRRFVLVALRSEYAPYFHWPEQEDTAGTVGETLLELMGSRGWELVEEWADGAHGIAPTIVGGSKKHGGADLGPIGTKRAWAEMGVDALGIANEPPAQGVQYEIGPKLTCDMVALIQGFRAEWNWCFTGRKTSMYRQIGNACPPPLARSIGRSIAAALTKEAPSRPISIDTPHDPIYRALRDCGDYMTAEQIIERVAVASGRILEPHELEQGISLLGRDFNVEIANGSNITAYKLGDFKAFTGQVDHSRHGLFLKHRAKIS